MLDTLTEKDMSTYIIGAFRYLDEDKYSRSYVTSEGWIRAIFGDVDHRITDVRSFALEAQECYQEIWEKNEEYPNQTYLACLAYEKTLQKRIKALNGGCATKA